MAKKTIDSPIRPLMDEPSEVEEEDNSPGGLT